MVYQQACMMLLQGKRDNRIYKKKKQIEDNNNIEQKCNENNKA